MSMRLSATALSSQAHQGLVVPFAFHNNAAPILLSYISLTNGRTPSTSYQRRTLCWWGYHRGRWPPHSESRCQKKVPRRDRPYVHKCMPHRRRDIWREQSPVFNLREQSWAGRNDSSSWRHRGDRQNSRNEKGSWWDVSHRGLWKEFEAEHKYLDKEFEKFKKQIDADPFGALFGRRLQRLNYHPHIPNSWTSFCHSLFGNNEPAGSKTTNSGKSEKDIKDKTGSTTKSTDSAEKPMSHAETLSEKSTPNSSSNTDIPFEFDPISGRMVPRNAPPTVESGTLDSVESDNGVDIPVKKFKSNQTQPSPQIPATSVGETGDGGFVDTGLEGSIGRPEDIQIGGQNTGTAKPIKETKDVGNPQPGSSEKQQDSCEEQPAKSQPQNAIWRFWKYPNLTPLFSRENNVEETVPLSEKLPDKERFEDPRDEDLDLLRSSDIRASYGSTKPKQGMEEEGKKDREELERDFDSYRDVEQNINIQDLRVRARGEEESDKAAGEMEPETERERIQKENIDNLADEIQGIYEDAYGKINNQQGRVTFEKSHLTEGYSPEATPQPEAMGSSKVYTSFSGVTHDSHQADSQDSTPPAISAETNNSAIYRGHVAELLEDIREFKESSSILLNELVQTLDRLAGSVQIGEPVRPATYKILAYDPSSSQVTDAEVTSSAYSAEETPLSPEDVFSYLNNPAKFLPYLSQLDAEGYEVVSGTGDVLVFKKVRPSASTLDGSVPAPVTPLAESSSQMAHPEKESIDQVEGDPTVPHPDPFSSSSPSSSPTMVHRQETVFTGGPPNWSPHPPPPPVDPDHPKTGHSSSSTGNGDKKESFLHKTSRRVLLTGAATAGTCYAIGVVSEYFRTGGQDGKGPEGFTAI